jgi:hypothetical protein
VRDVIQFIESSSIIFVRHFVIDIEFETIKYPFSMVAMDIVIFNIVTIELSGFNFEEEIRFTLRDGFV